VSRATYTEADKARVYVTLITNSEDGTIQKANVKRTARDESIPENTVRRWKKEFIENGPPSTEEVERAVGEFLDEAVELRGMALEALRRKVKLLLDNPKEVKVAELTTLMGVLDDKITRASGLATSRTEHTLALPSGDELVQPLLEAFKAVQTLTKQREGEVIEDAEFSDITEQKALPKGEQA
jgi:transposase-like protein